MDWDDIKYFLAVARSGGLTVASVELNVSPATVSRRIEAFERSLNKTLFIKRQTGYLLTDDGEKVLTGVEAVESAVMKFERQTLQPSEQEPFDGLIRIAASELTASYLIAPRLNEFFKKFPLLRVELLTGIDQVNLSRRVADIALRMTPPAKGEEGEHIAHALGNMNFAPYMSSSRSNKNDWRSLPYISWDKARNHYPMSAWIASAYAGVDPLLTSNSLNVQLAATRHGIGLSVLPTFVGDKDPQLVRIVLETPIVSRPLWIVYHRDLRGNKRVGAMREFLTEICNDIDDVDKA
jgi:DNA-binding transcriptional LysR family regulator